MSGIKQQLVKFNNTSIPYRSSVPAHRLFEEQAERTPDNISVVFKGQRLTYQGLNRRANQLAHYLRGLGVGPEVFVNICMERSVEMVVGILGILKAGGAYTPMEPTYPKERLAFMTMDTQTPVLITQERLARVLPEHGTKVVCLDADWDVIGRQDEDNTVNEATARNLAYVIYTSGSTGKPKGVMVEHYAINNLVAGLYEHVYRRYVGTLNVALVASCVFDASVQQIFGSLLLGHTLCIVPDGVNRDGKLLLAYYRDNAIDISDGTPALISMLVNAGTSIESLSVKHFIIGGEALPLPLVKRFYDVFGIYKPGFTNIYGPAECCVDSTAFLVDPARLEELTTVPIGSPMANRRVYILGEDLNLVPTGTSGELCVSGEGLGRGYLNRPDLTAERFLPDIKVPGARMYKTGDIGRWQADGNIEFIGRDDDQVKIRGFRIELGEIECALRNHTAIRDCIVLVKDRKAKGTSGTQYCRRCCISSNMPNVSFDSEGICRACRDYELFKGRIEKYFRTEDDLIDLFEKARRNAAGERDCLLLYSGGKDSTYALYKLVDMGLRVLTFTLDNGFLSPAAFDNIERVCQELNVENVKLTPANMDDIFVESLRITSDVCAGCFRALNFLGTRMAIKRNIPIVVTGLSRGQIYETKLAGFIQQREFNVERIEEQLSMFRKMYHYTNDGISKLLNDTLADEAAFDKIHFVDFWRYYDATEEEVIKFLEEKSSCWKMPTDTGSCSSNCLINDVGIWVHLQDKGYHRYADELGWEVRLGRISRETAMSKLQSGIDRERISHTLNEIGYKRTNTLAEMPEKYLCAYVIRGEKISVSEIRESLLRTLPEYMLPPTFVFCDAFPLTVNGKVDRKALPQPGGERPRLNTAFVAPRAPHEERLAEVWRDVLALREVGIYDSFFELGGDSLLATKLVSRVNNAFQVTLSPRCLFENPTVAALAELIKEIVTEKLLGRVEALTEEEARYLLQREGEM